MIIYKGALTGIGPAQLFLLKSPDFNSDTIVDSAVTVYPIHTVFEKEG